MNQRETPLNNTDLAQYIDHTLLRPDAVEAAIDKTCEEAIRCSFRSVCVNSCWSARVANRLQGSAVLLCSVIGFPLGAMDSGCKAHEAALCAEVGSKEVDMVMNIGFLKSGNITAFQEDIGAVRNAIGAQTVLKVIIETGLLSDEEKARACTLAVAAGTDFVKTCTGFLGGGATVEDIVLMRRTVGPDIGVKASGGIRTTEDARALIAAGASRIGSSQSVAIVQA
jgi:deoxyribose-phosphate aldolase